VTVQVVTTGVAEGVGLTMLADSVDRGVIGVVAVVAGLVGVDASGVSSDDADGLLAVGVCVCASGVAVDVAVAALSLSTTWGDERMFVEVPSSKAATARHTTRLVTAVARSHDAAATSAIRLRDLFPTGQS